MPRYSKDIESACEAADLLSALNAPSNEFEPQPEAQPEEPLPPQTGLIVFSFGRNGGFNKPTDQSVKQNSVA